MPKLKDLTGQRFGKLIVVKRAGSSNSGGAIWECQCDCGNIAYVRSDCLTRKNGTKSCGCISVDNAGKLNKGKIMREDLTGRKFGRLTVIEFSHKEKNGVYWKCRCDCGNVKAIKAYSLKSGASKSCGCYNKEPARGLNYKHGKTNTRLYRIWKNMKERCGNPSNNHYESYGGRGITVCGEWDDTKNGFIAFYNWAISHGYAENLTLERKDVNGNYCPENCCWITLTEQQRNKRNNVYVEINGEKKLLSDWEKDTGVDSSVLTNRIKRGVKEEHLLHKGLLRGKMIEYNGEERNLTDWCKLLGIDFKKSYRRLRDGWNIEEVFQGFRNKE